MTDEKWWVFTFGCGQKYAGKYVAIYGTFDDARRKMFDRYGKEWCMQYSAEDWAEWLESKPEWIPTETLLETIK